MEIKKGRHRLAIIIGNIVIKIPRLNLLNIWRYLTQDWELKNLPSKASLWSYKQELTGGFKENFREAKLYKLTKHRLLAPIILALYIINVYKKCSGVGKINIDLFYNKIYFETKHHPFALKLFRNRPHNNPSNFFFDGERVGIVDYGAKITCDLIVEYGDELEDLLLEAALNFGNAGNKLQEIINSDRSKHNN